MSGRQGGKLKPLKAPKKKQGNGDDSDEEGAAFKAKQKADAQKLKEMAAVAAKGGVFGSTGIKKSGKK